MYLFIYSLCILGCIQCTLLMGYGKIGLLKPHPFSGSVGWKVCQVLSVLREEWGKNFSIAGLSHILPLAGGPWGSYSLEAM